MSFCIFPHLHLVSDSNVNTVTAEFLALSGAHPPPGRSISRAGACWRSNPRPAGFTRLSSTPWPLQDRDRSRGGALDSADPGRRAPAGARPANIAVASPRSVGGSRYFFKRPVHFDTGKERGQEGNGGRLCSPPSAGTRAGSGEAPASSSPFSGCAAARAPRPSPAPWAAAASGLCVPRRAGAQGSGPGRSCNPSSHFLVASLKAAAVEKQNKGYCFISSFGFRVLTGMSLSRIVTLLWALRWGNAFLFFFFFLLGKQSRCIYFPPPPRLRDGARGRRAQGNKSRPGRLQPPRLTFPSASSRGPAGAAPSGRRRVGGCQGLPGAAPAWGCTAPRAPPFSLRAPPPQAAPRRDAGL